MTLWEQVEKASKGAEFDSVNAPLPDDTSGMFCRRDSFVSKFSWAVPSRSAVGEIAKFIGRRRTLEVCAGLGLWAKLLSDEGVNIVATDLYPNIEPPGGKPPEETNLRDPYVPVRRCGAKKAVRTISAEVLLIVWPPYLNPPPQMRLEDSRETASCT